MKPAKAHPWNAYAREGATRKRRGRRSLMTASDAFLDSLDDDMLVERDEAPIRFADFSSDSNVWAPDPSEK